MDLEKYLKLEEVEWDYKTPLYSHALDEYIFDQEDLECILEELDEDNGEITDPGTLMLVVCRENKYDKIGLEFWEDITPNDVDFPKELIDKVEEFNKFLETLPSPSWRWVNKRISYIRDEDLINL
jgi:hypothetical protein